MTNTNGVNYFDGTRIVTTTVGTAGQALTSNGSGNAPTFEDVSTALTVNDQTVEVYTLVLTDASKLITMTYATANTLIVPPNSEVAFAIGTQIYINQNGAGVTTIVGGQGVTIANASDLQSLLDQYSSVTLIKQATNTWIIAGDLSGVTIDLANVDDGNSGSTAYGVKFSPNQNFIAVTGQSTGKSLAVWSWNKLDTITEVETVNVASNFCVLNDWHPNGNFLAVAVYSATGSVRVYSWNGTDTLTEVESLNVAEGFSVDWHPSGDYLAFTTYDTSASIKIYSWNGTDTLTEVESLNTGVASKGCKWSNSGNFLYIGSPLANKQVAVYSWNGTDTLTEAATYSESNEYVNACWYSDDSYLFVAHRDGPASLEVYAFNGTDTLTNKQTIDTGFNGYGVDIFDDKYVVAAAYSTGVETNAYLKLYTFNITTEQLTLKDSISYNARGCLDLNFSKNGKFLAVGMMEETSVTLRVVKLY
jgi:WD40 repeat protein